MEMYRKTIGKQSTLILSTDSDLFKFLKSADAMKKQNLPGVKSRQRTVPPLGVE